MNQTKIPAGQPAAFTPGERVQTAAYIQRFALDQGAAGEVSRLLPNPEPDQGPRYAVVMDGSGSTLDFDAAELEPLQ